MNMVIRTYSFGMPYRPVYGYVLLLAALLVMSWDNALENAAVAPGAIPAEAIRLRILANSDSAPDQAVKRHVRGAVAGELKRLTAGAESAAEARDAIAAALPELEALVKRELAARGFGYGASVRLGPAPFPAKIHGGRVYPAGEYDALVITLGAGRGENWWCVLFPPLCFADAVKSGKPEKREPAGEAIGARNAAVAGSGGGMAECGTEGGRDRHAAIAVGSKADGAEAHGRDAVNGPESKRDAGNAADGGRDARHAQDAAAKTGKTAGDAQDVEIRFAIWDLLQRVLDFFRRLFG